jgi:hypothetical protein
MLLLFHGAPLEHCLQQILSQWWCCVWNVSFFWMKKFSVLTTQLKPFNCASTLLVIRMNLQKILQMYFNNVTEIMLILQLVKQKYHTITIGNQQFKLG